MNDYEKAKLDPTQIFSTPQEVLEREDFSRDQKIEVLRRWVYDAQLIAVAGEENMSPLSQAPEIDLQDILKALHELDAEINLNDHPTKAGC